MEHPTISSSSAHALVVPLALAGGIVLFVLLAGLCWLLVYQHQSKTRSEKLSLGRTLPTPPAPVQGWPTWSTPPPTTTEGSIITESRSNYSQSSFAPPSSVHARSGLTREAGEMEMREIRCEEKGMESDSERPISGYELHRCQAVEEGIAEPDESTPSCVA